jgi:hypothetical protein
MDLLLWLEETWLALYVRESESILGYPTVLFMHTLGLAMVAGFSAVLNLRVLGFARSIPYGALAAFIPVIWIGLAVTVASGTALIVAAASTKLLMPVFHIKLIFVVAALVMLHRLTKQVFRNPLADRSPLPPRAHLLALASLVCWAGATTAGRLMAYIV